jgi:ferredoxin
MLSPGDAGSLTMSALPAVRGATTVASPATSPVTLSIDRIRCDGFGMCAELLPELVDLDDWGYPILRAGAVPDDLLGHARRAVEACPVLALRLRSAPIPTHGRG